MLGGRKLTPEEIADLRSIYGDQVDYSKIRVHDNHWTAVIPGVGAFVIGNNIQLAGKYVGDRKILIHETAHVWQFQRDWGWNYFFTAAGEHIRRKLFGGPDPYDYTPAEGVLPWSRWGVEQQAQWIMDNERLPEPGAVKK
ncbi:MAG TPA: hypothetical protein PLQ76_04925 [bacterium]|nr:hypothetical protein [bacterium]